IHSPDEFDMMLKLQVPSCLCTTKLDAGLFYRIDLTRPTRHPIKDFLLENNRTLSSSKILTEMFRLIRKFLKTYTGLCRTTLREACSPTSLSLNITSLRRPCSLAKLGCSWSTSWRSRRGKVCRC
ncbi:hypothetical protein GOODEAATRI_027168, partial [Goodea atripinnis]